MKLNQYERQALINQFSIRKALEKGNTESLDEKIEILRCGYEVFYSEVFGEAYPDDEVMTKEEGKFVLEVLTMYRVLEAFKDRHPAEAAKLNEKLLSRFEGFDGNNESAHLGFTRFLIEEQGKFTEQVKYAKDTDNFNSHSQHLDAYGRMLAVYNSHVKTLSSTGFDKMTAEQAHAIVDAARHP